MAWKSGESGNPTGKKPGTLKEKPFREALRMEEKELAAGNVIQHPEGSLRWNAQLLLRRGDTPSIHQIADRLDGKPAQEQAVHVSDGRTNQSEAELRDYIAAALLASANAAATAKADKPDEKTKLN
jgi:hypothetical protein